MVLARTWPADCRGHRRAVMGCVQGGRREWRPRGLAPRALARCLVRADAGAAARPDLCVHDRCRGVRVAPVHDRPITSDRPPNAIAWAYAFVSGSVDLGCVVQCTPAAARHLARGWYPARRVW